MQQTPPIASPAAQPDRWMPAVPWGVLAEKWRTKAHKLQTALLPFLRRLEDPSVSVASLAEEGRALHQRIFKFSEPISVRHWERLVQRTLERDGGALNWNRVEIFVDDKAGRRRTAATCRSEFLAEHKTALNETVEHLENRADPTDDDRAYLLDAAFRHYESLSARHTKHKVRRRLKTSLLDYLLAAVPALAKNVESLRRVFDLKLAAWQAGGQTPQAIMDQRRLKSGNFRRPDFAADRKVIRDMAIQFGGSESLAHRQARKRGLLSKEFCDHYTFDMRQNKSYVPHTIRADITPEVEAVEPLTHSEREAKLRGPWIRRDWSDEEPGNYFSGDDVTWNHRFWFWNDDDLGRRRAIRGECLLITDLRTFYPLHVMLIAGHYNSEHVRSLCLQAHDKAGLPHEGYYFEGGVFQARLVPGERRKGAKWRHWRETENGLQALKLSVSLRHATTPRAKPIEGMLHILQDLMRCEPGFVGFNERQDKIEDIQEFVVAVNERGADPRERLLSMADWSKRIDAILHEFAHDPQNGDMLPGVSPAETWAEAMQRKALVKLPPEARAVFATHEQRVTVRQEGIVLTIRGQRRIYANEHTGRFIGRPVLTHYNVEYPQLLTVSDLDRREYFAVPELVLPAMSATPEQFARVHAQIAGHRRPAKVIHSEMRPHVVTTITRDDDADEATRQRGRFIAESVEQHKQSQNEEQRDYREAQRLCAELGRPFKPSKNLPQYVRALQMLLEIRAKRTQPVSPLSP